MIQRELSPQPYPQPRRLRFTVDQYYKMIDLGMIDTRERSEIIGDELFAMSSKSDIHAWAVSYIIRFFIQTLSDRFHVRCQNPLRLGEYDEPEPDVLLVDRNKYTEKRHPRAPETLLVVEVSDTSLKYDRHVKLPLYAEAGIPEAWIVNIPMNLVEVHCQPNVGVYLAAKIYGLEDTIKSETLPELSLPVCDLLA